MSHLRNVGCLLFVAHSYDVVVGRDIKARLDAPSVQMYAILPRLHGHLYEELRDVFEENQVLLLSSREDCPATLTAAIGLSRVEVLEMLLDLRLYWSEVHIKAFVDDENYEGLAHLFQNTMSLATCFGMFPFDVRKVIDQDSLSILGHLLTFGSDIHYRHRDGGTLLHLAVLRKEEQLVRLLLHSGARVDARNLKNQSPLHIAVDYTIRLPIVELLVSHGADVMAAIDESNDTTPLQIALKRRCRSPEVLNLLLANGASASVVASPVTTLEEALWCGPECLRCVLNQCPDLSVSLKQDFLRTTLKDSPYFKKEAISVLVEQGFDLSAEDAGDVELLFRVVESGNLHLLETLLSWGASVRDTNYRGFTAFHRLVSYFDENVAQFLLDRGADINAIDSFGETALSQAVTLENLEAFNYLLAHGARIEDGEKLLHLVVIGHEKETVKILERLLETPDINVNAANGGGYTPIMTAALEEREDFMEILLRHGAIIDPSNDIYQEILSICILHNKLGVVKILVEHGVDVQTIMKDDLLVTVRRKKNPAVVQFLLELDDPRAKTFDDFKIPEAIIEPGMDPTIVQEVLEHGYLKLQPIFESKVFNGDLKLYFSEEMDENENILYLDAADGVRDPKDVLCNHMNAVIALNLSINSSESDILELPHWCVRRASNRPPTDWVGQVEAMKSTMVGESNVSYYEVLDMSMSQVVRFLRNNNAPSEVELGDVSNGQGFPMYLGLISKRFRKAVYRKSLMDRGVKIVNFIIPQFRSLPHELKEVIIDLLSNQHLRVLLRVCPLPPEN